MKLKDLWIHHYVVLRDTNGEVIRDKNGCARPVYAIGDDEFPPKDLPAGLKGALVPLWGDDVEELKSTVDEVEPCDVWDPYPYMVDPNSETGETGWFTIDAPLENLGLYDRIMKFGTLLRVEYVRVEQEQMWVVEESAPDWNVFVLADDLESLHPCCPGSPDSCDPYATCDPYSGAGALENCDEMLNPTGKDILIGASTFAAAGDKTGFFTTDAMIHVNTYLGINDLDADPDEYFPYTLRLDVPYDRYTQFGSKTPVPLLQTYPEDWTCVAGPGILLDYPCFYVAEIVAYQAATFQDIPHCTARDTDYFYQIEKDVGPTIEMIFYSTLETKGYDAEHLGSAQQVAQAAEDASAIIWYIHNLAVPELSDP